MMKMKRKVKKINKKMYENKNRVRRRVRVSITSNE